eukprot:GHVL01025679.1.p2 GENE.GHVL01025679.1~~GHVL01025679.1.p2  ORF type:complete len:274 (-),score=95.97 GHVL01025679.1:1705-2526(-)
MLPTPSNNEKISENLFEEYWKINKIELEYAKKNIIKGKVRFSNKIDIAYLPYEENINNRENINNNRENINNNRENVNNNRENINNNRENINNNRENINNNRENINNNNNNNRENNKKCIEKDILIKGKDLNRCINNDIVYIILKGNTIYNDKEYRTGKVIYICERKQDLCFIATLRKNINNFTDDIINLVKYITNDDKYIRAHCCDKRMPYILIPISTLNIAKIIVPGNLDILAFYRVKIIDWKINEKLPFGILTGPSIGVAGLLGVFSVIRT